VENYQKNHCFQLQAKFQKKHPADEIPNRQNDGRLRIGFYSADLYYHPVSIWLAEQLENHDKSKFELFAFSDVIGDVFKIENIIKSPDKNRYKREKKKK
jgi:predicted O-linked N-acetylglucosamine transferase (SPINDLY family)